jgi:NHL repeat
MLLATALALISTASAAHSASSYLKSTGVSYTSAAAFDGLLTTGWAEGNAANNGAGEWLELDLGKATPLELLALWPGNLSEGQKSFREYSRPRTIRVLVDGQAQGEPIRVEDRMQRLEVPLTGSGRKIRVEVVDVYDGIVYPEMYIAELAVNFPNADAATRLDAWLESKEAQRLAEDFNQDIDAAYEKCKAAQFGDSEAFAVISRAVAEGPTFLHKKVQASVPDGYRAQAIRSSKKAQKALRKLLDANGMAALELASLRAIGPEKRELAEMAEMLVAYSELKGGGRRNIGYWGESGWEVGAIQSFGEPINLEIDRLGNIYVADLGNNRIQVFSEEGKPERVIGPKADISSAWFGKGRKWYVSGSATGEDNKQWHNAVDIDLMPQKEVDHFVGIDGQGKIQIYDDQGRQLISWRAESKNEAEPGLGGTSYVAWVPNKEQIIAIIGDEAITFRPDSEEVARWEIKDGTPNAVEVLPNGKLLMAFGDQVIEYATDGFRQGVVVDDGILGEGFEDMDLTLDNEGKLWILTDTGWAFRFKKPGKVEFKIKAIDKPLKNPRIAVKQGLLYAVSNDHIEQVDITQLQLDQAAAEKEKGGE